MYELPCRHTYDDGEEIQWNIHWRILDERPENHELLVRGRGSEYRVVLGQCTTGLYMCIPTMDIGCGLAHTTDILWNRTQIAAILNETDAVTIATAIYCYGQLSDDFPCN